MWRVAFACYAVALFTATHWPSPTLPLGGVPLSDKAYHFLAFALWAWLLLLTRLTPWRNDAPRPVPPFVIALAYACVDEGLQLIPALKRSADWGDLLADVLGAGAAIALFVTTRTGRTNRANASQNTA